MPTTSNFGWTTPADTDLVKNGALAIRTLGNGIDTSFLDLKGGTTGQILSKASNTDLDYTWINNDQGDITEVQAGTGISVASGTGPIPVVTNTVATAFDAKGDLIGGTGADTFSRLAVGTNGQVLIADSTTATGLKWGSVSSTPTYVGASAYRTTALSCNNGADVTVTFDAEYFDTDGIHSTTTSTERFTVPTGKGGKWLVTYAFTFAANSSGIRWSYIYKNTVDVYTTQNLPTTASNTVTISGSVVLNLVAGDYIYLKVGQNSGGALNLNPDYPTSLQFSYLGA